MISQERREPRSAHFISPGSRLASVLSNSSHRSTLLVDALSHRSAAGTGPAGRDSRLARRRCRSTLSATPASLSMADCRKGTPAWCAAEAFSADWRCCERAPGRHRNARRWTSSCSISGVASVCARFNPRRAWFPALALGRCERVDRIGLRDEVDVRSRVHGRFVDGRDQPTCRGL